MARHLSVGTVVEKNKIASNVAFVILLDLELVDPNTREVVDIIYLARNTENVLFGADENGDPRVYEAANFTIQVDQKQGSAPSVTLTANDQSRMIQSRLDAMAGGIFSNVMMTVVNTDRLDKPPEMQERFQVVSASVKNYVVSVQLGAENPLNITFPKHMQRRDRCAWRYRGYGCGYSGTMLSCSYTKDGDNGCIAHGNTINFRALPGLVVMNI